MTRAARGSCFMHAQGLRHFYSPESNKIKMISLACIPHVGGKFMVNFRLVFSCKLQGYLSWSVFKGQGYMLSVLRREFLLLGKMD